MSSLKSTHATIVCSAPATCSAPSRQSRGSAEQPVLDLQNHLRLFPATGLGEPDDWLSLLHHLVLPATTLGLASTAYIARLTRSAMLEVIRQDYIRTARSKGLAERWVIARHALRNALIPVLSL
ncbi:hypothetical protein C2W62_47525, partial [Candidatus Entotheonella serta]